MKNKLTNDLSLLEEMIKDQNSKYKVDPFWKNYEYSNVAKIKHFDLKKLLHLMGNRL
mgnify:CR=1 FL=1